MSCTNANGLLSVAVVLLILGEFMCYYGLIESNGLLPELLAILRA